MHRHADDMPDDIRNAVGTHFPIVLARSGATLVPLLSPDGLARNGKVADLRGRLRHNARLQGLTLT